MQPLGPHQRLLITHVLCAADLVSQRARIRGTMGYRMGQQFQLGSYPFHFHFADETMPDTAHMTDNSVYLGYWRCFTIHRTHNLLVANNTCFHVYGSGEGPGHLLPFGTFTPAA
jgi:hypothetical protein